MGCGVGKQDHIRASNRIAKIDKSPHALPCGSLKLCCMLESHAGYMPDHLYQSLGAGPRHPRQVNQQDHLAAHTAVWRSNLTLRACSCLCSAVSNSLRPHGLQPARLLCPWDSPGKNRGCHALLQGIFPTHGSTPGLLYCRQILYRLSYLGSRESLLETH